jgi:hypothetical protein
VISRARWSARRISWSFGGCGSGSHAGRRVESFQGDGLRREGRHRGRPAKAAGGDAGVDAPALAAGDGPGRRRGTGELYPAPGLGGVFTGPDSATDGRRHRGRGQRFTLLPRDFAKVQYAGEVGMGGVMLLPEAKQDIEIVVHDLLGRGVAECAAACRADALEPLPDV